jgi:hypothetical protein
VLQPMYGSTRVDLHAADWIDCLAVGRIERYEPARLACMPGGSVLVVAIGRVGEVGMAFSVRLVAERGTVGHAGFLIP